MTTTHTNEALSNAQIEARRRQRALRMKQIFGNAYLWLLLVVLYAPILMIIVFSFTKSKVFGNWTGFTLQLYGNLFTGYDSAAQVRVDPNLYRAEVSLLGPMVRWSIR